MFCESFAVLLVQLQGAANGEAIEEGTEMAMAVGF